MASKNCGQCASYHYSKDDFGTFSDTWCKKHPEKEIEGSTKACEDFEATRMRSKRRSKKENDIYD